MTSWLRQVSLALVSGLLLTGAGAWAATPEQTVAEHLAAGEFGLAAQVAGNAAPEVQAQLLQQVAEAQQGAGAERAAMGTVRRLPASAGRSQARLAAARRAALAGGGAMADFGSLMMLIENNTGDADAWDEDLGGTQTPYFNGVRVAPGQLLTRITATDRTNRLAKLGEQVRAAELNADMAAPSGLRMISLKRLEREVASQLEQGLPVPESMARLAGLSKLQYIVFDPQTQDVLIGGPAEAWTYGQNGEPVGVDSGRPMLHLDDLVVALRAFAAGQPDFGCSINTRDEGVRALQQYAAQSQARGPLNAGSVRNWVNQLQRRLGMQDIVVWGVPEDSRVARVIVEADYRMKLIGINKLDGGPNIPSYFELLSAADRKNPPAMEALRWWLTMKYDAVVHSPDRSVFEVQGSAVLCQSENQMLTAEGKHLPTGKSEPTNRLFAENFTQHYAELARRDQVFADLQNVFDLALVAALVRDESMSGRSAWKMGVFAPAGDYRPASHVVPKEVESVVNHRVYNGRDIVVQVAGGVRGDLIAVVKDPVLTKESNALTAVTRTTSAPELPAGRWWWDASK